ncbi:unnamed protein product, partial [Phaeothamnion confervicola]
NDRLLYGILASPVNATGTATIAPDPSVRPRLDAAIEYLSEQKRKTGGEHAKATSRGTQAVRKVEAGLALLCMLVQRRVPVFLVTEPKADDAAHALVNCLETFHQKNVFEAAAETCGIVAEHIDRLVGAGAELCAAVGLNGNQFLKKVRLALEKIAASHELNKASEFLVGLSGVVRHSPAFLTHDLLVRALGKQEICTPRAKAAFLTMLADSAEPQLLGRLSPPLSERLMRGTGGWRALLVDPDLAFRRNPRRAHFPHVQLAALRLVRRLLPEMPPAVLGRLLDPAHAYSLVSLSAPHVFLDCREEAFAALLDVYRGAVKPAIINGRGNGDGGGSNGDDNDADAGIGGNGGDGGGGGSKGGGSGRTAGGRDDGSPDSRISENSRRAVRCALLRGLVDPDTAGMLNAGDGEATAPAPAPVVEATATVPAAAQVGDAASAAGTAAAMAAAAGKPRKGIRRRMYDFWDDPQKLSEAPLQRMVALCTELFDHVNSQEWLHYACFLLLRLPALSPQYGEALSDQPLAEMRFTDMPLGALGAAGNFDLRPMTPIFSMASQCVVTGGASGGEDNDFRQSGPLAATLSMDPMGSLAALQAPRGAGMLRATQDWTYTQTQQGSGFGGLGSGSAGGMTSQTQRIPATGRGDRFSGGGGGGGGGGRFGTLAPGVGSQCSMLPPPPRAPAGARAAETAMQGPAASQRFGRERLNRRGAWTAAASGSQKLATQSFERRRLQREREQRGARQRRIVLYRKYRDGELPDIQIPRSDLIRPLQHLATQDGQMARQTFALLFGAVFKAVGKPEMAGRCDPAVERRRLAASLRAMLAAAKHQTDLVAALQAAVASAVHCSTADAIGDGSGAGTGSRNGSGGGAGAGGDGAVGLAELHLTPALVAESSLQSLNAPSGILLLEEAIMRDRILVVAAASRRRHGGGAGGRGCRSGADSSTGGGADIKPEPAESASSGAKEVEDPAAQDAWLQLSRLYSELGERDALVGLSARTSRVLKTRWALEAELEGDFDMALRIYSALRDKHTTSDGGWDGGDNGGGGGGGAKDEEVEQAGEAELATWDMRELECCRQLA